MNQNKKPRKKSRFRQRFRFFLLFSFTTLFLAIFVLAIFYRAGKLHDWALDYARESIRKAGGTLEVATFKGGLLSPVSLQGLKLTIDPEHGDTIHASLDSLTLDIHWARLWTKDYWFESLDIQNPNVEIIYKKDKVRKEKMPREKPLNITQYVDYLPRTLVLKDGFFHLQFDEKHHIRVENINALFSHCESGVVKADIIDIDTAVCEFEFKNLRAPVRRTDDMIRIRNLQLDDPHNLQHLNLDLNAIAHRELQIDFILLSDGGTIDGDFNITRIHNDAIEINIKLDAQSVDLNTLQQSFKLPIPYHGHLDSLSFTASGDPKNWMDTEANLALSGVDFIYKDFPIDFLEIEAGLHNRLIHFHPIRLLRDADYISLEGNAYLPDLMENYRTAEFEVQSTISITDIQHWSQWFPDSMPALQSLSFSTYLTASLQHKDEQWSGETQTTLWNISYQDKMAAEVLQAVVQLENNFLNIQHLSLNRNEDVINALGTLQIQKDPVFDIVVEGGIDEARYYLQFLPDPDLPVLSNLQTGAFQFTLKSEGTFSQPETQLHLYNSQWVFAPDGSPLPETHLDAWLSLSANSWKIDHLNIQQGNLQLSLAIELNDAQLALSHFLLQGTPGVMAHGHAWLPLVQDETLWIKKPLENIDFSKNIYVDIQSDKLQLKDLTQLFGGAFNAKGILDFHLLCNTPLSNPDLNLTLRGNDLTFSIKDFSLPSTQATLQLQILHNQLTTQGSIQLSTAPPMIFSGSLPYAMTSTPEGYPYFDSSQPFDGNLSLQKVNLSLVKLLAPDIHTVTGTISGDIITKGTFDSPEIQGTLHLEDATLRINPDLPKINNISAELILTQSSATLEFLRGDFAAGPFSATGHFDLTDIKNPGIQFHLTGEKLLIVRNENLRVRTNVDIHIDGTLSQSHISGTADLIDSRFYRTFELKPIRLLTSRTLHHSSPQLRAAPQDFSTLPPLFSITKEPLSNWTFNIHIRNATPFLLTGNLATGSVESDIYLEGTAAEPFITGSIETHNASLYFPFAVLEIQKGTVLFSEENPNTPYLNIHARSRIRDFLVEAYLHGPLSERNLTLRSDPPLDQDAIITLLTTGLVPEEVDADFGRAALGRGSVLLVRSLLNRFGNIDPSETDWLDRIEVNILPPSHRNTSDIIQSELHITDSISLQAERDEWGFYNGGVEYSWRFK